MTISSDLLLENEVKGVILVPDHPQVQNNNTKWQISIIHADPNLTGNVEETKIYTTYVLCVKVKKKLG